jgi:hypothetical protein
MVFEAQIAEAAILFQWGKTCHETPHTHIVMSKDPATQA